MSQVDDDKKSIQSQSSTLTMGSSHGDSFSKVDEFIFKIFYPLYDQKKNPRKDFEAILWGIQFIQLFTLAFFCIDTKTNEQTPISYYLNFVDFTTLSFLPGTYIRFVAFGFFGLHVLLAVYIGVVAGLSSLIFSTQPWIVTVLRFVIRIVYTILYIPLITMAITVFDCYVRSDGRRVLRYTDVGCFNDWSAVIGFVLCIIHLVLMLACSAFFNLLLYNHNEKKGGWFASAEGKWQALRSTMIFGLIFAMRMLWDWPFWRGFVTVGTSLFLCIYFMHIQPCYNFSGNYLNALPFAVFGGLRLFLEIGIAITVASDSMIPTIVFAVLGVAAGVGASIACYKYGRKREKAIWIVDQNGQPLFEYHSGSNNLSSSSGYGPNSNHSVNPLSSSAFNNGVIPIGGTNNQGMNGGGIDNPSQLTPIMRPPMPEIKHPEKVEPSLRFLTNYKFRTYEHLQYADAMYTHALRKNRSNALLNFNYANFLETFRKNYMKSQTVFRQARASSPSFFLRFTLYCKTKESNNQAAGKGGGELSSMSFTALFNKATEQHNVAREALKDFFDNVTLLKPNFKLLPTHLHLIVTSEAESRKDYEELIASHPKNTAVLRSYARLLMDIYDDEDTASIILSRADQLEEDSTVSITGGTVNAGNENLHHALSKGHETNEKKDETSKLDAMFDQMKMPDDHKEKEHIYKEATPVLPLNEGINNNNNNNNNNNPSGSSTPTSSTPLIKVDDNTGAQPSQLSGGIDSISPAPLAPLSDGNVGGEVAKTEQDIAAEMYAIHQSRIEEHKEKMRQQMEKASRASGASVAKRKKKKKKKGKSGESVIAELTGGGNENNVNTISKIIEGALILLHLSLIIALVAGLIVYINITSAYADELGTLERVCRVITSTARLSNTVLQFLIHDLRFDFDWDYTDNNIFYNSSKQSGEDGYEYSWETTLMPLNVVVNLLTTESESLSSIAHDIYDLTSELETWISQSIRVYRYTMGKINRTNINGKVRQVPSFERLEINKVSLVSCLDSLATMSKIMSETDVSKKTSPEYEQYFDDVMFVVVNGPQSAVDGAKKAILAFMQDADEKNNNAILFYSLIVGASGGIVILAVLCIYLYFTVKFSHSRTEAYYSLLDIPKNKLQAVIRRLLDAEKDEGEDTTISRTMTFESQEGNEGNENEINDEERFDDYNYEGVDSENEKHNQNMLDQTNDQGDDKGLNNSPGNSSANNGSNTFQQGMSLLPSNNISTDPTMMNMKMGDGTNNQTIPNLNIGQPTTVGNIPGVNGTGMNLGGFNNLMTGGMTTNMQLTQGMMNQMLIDQPSLIGNQQPSLIQSSMPLAQNASLLQNQPSLSLPMNSQMAGNQLSLAGKAGPQSLVGMNSNMAMTSPMGANATTDTNNKKEEKSDKKEEEKKLLNNYADEEMDEQQIEAMIGYIRNEVDDQQWEGKIETDLQKLLTSYSALPNPIDFIVIACIVCSLVILVAVVIVMIVVTFITVTNTQTIARNIILSGTRVSVLMQMKFILLRMCYTMEYLMPSERADFSEVTNPVWKDDTHLSSDKTYLLSLLQKMSNYFQALHSDCHYGDSEYGVTNDSIFDSVSVTRLPVQQNSDILLGQADCYSASGADCSTLDPHRMYGLSGPIYGLSTIIARFRLGITRLSTWNAETIDEFTDEIRFISTAIYKDLQEGISMLTGDILDEGVSGVDNAQSIMIGLTIGLSALLLFELLLAATQWRIRIIQLENESQKLLQLLPKIDLEAELQMLPAMKTGLSKMDTGREHILDGCVQLLEAIHDHDNIEVIMGAHKQLMQLTYREFQDEEELMKKTDYDPELMEKHKTHHIILRQRLTLIGDYLKQQTRTASTITLRALLSLFDNHFTDDDIQFGVPLAKKEEEEKALQQEGSQKYNEDNDNNY